MDSKYSNLISFLKLQSVSSDLSHRDDCISTANWLVDFLKNSGIDDARLLEAEGLPLVFAEIAADIDPEKAETVLFYGHYDVQPAGDLNPWNTDPFEPTIKGGHIYGRGTEDDKAQVMLALEAITQAKSEKKLAKNVKVLIEGEEEVGSPYIKNTLEKYKDLLRADYVLVCDSDMKPETPEIVIGLRGLVMFTFSLHNSTNNLHSGIYGGMVRNPATELGRIISQLVTPEGEILIPGVYDSVVELDHEILESLNQNNLSLEKRMEITGAHSFIKNTKYSANQMAKARPVLDINSLQSGVPIETPSTIIPAVAHAVFSIRLVANQKPEEVINFTRNYIDSIAPEGMEYELKVDGTYNPVMFSKDLAIYSKVFAAAEGIWANKPVFNFTGGSIGIVVDFKEILGLDTILFGFGLPTGNIHSANENFSLTQYEKGKRFITQFLSPS